MLNAEGCQCKTSGGGVGLLNSVVSSLEKVLELEQCSLLLQAALIDYEKKFTEADRILK